MKKIYTSKHKDSYTILIKNENTYEILYECISYKEYIEALKLYNDIPKEEICIKKINKPLLRLKYTLAFFISIFLTCCISIHYEKSVVYFNLIWFLLFCFFLIDYPEFKKDAVLKHENQHKIILDKYNIHCSLSIGIGNGLALPQGIIKKEYCLEALVNPLLVAKNNKSINIFVRYIRAYSCGLSDWVCYKKISKEKNCFAVEYKNKTMIYLYKNKFN